MAPWYCDPQIAGLNIVGDGRGYELMRKMALKIVDLFDLFIILTTSISRYALCLFIA